MPAFGSMLVLLVLVLGVGAGLALYVLVREEGADRAVMSRDAAERAARRDTRDDE